MKYIKKNIEKILSSWNSYWFPECTPLNLSVCRIIVVAAQLFLFFPSLKRQIQFLEKNEEFIDPQLLTYVLYSIIPELFSPYAFTLVFWITFAAGVTTLIGLFTRSSALIFALGNWFFIAHSYSYAGEHHSEALLSIFLLLLALSPSGECLSIDSFVRYCRCPEKAKKQTPKKIYTGIWPLKLTQTLLALAYFSTGLAKVAYGGSEWLNGYTLQQYIFESAMFWKNTVGVWLAQQYTICLLLSLFTVLFEIFFFLALFIPRTVPFFLIAGALFHIGIAMTMKAFFFQHIFLYSVFINFERYIIGAFNRKYVGECRAYV